MYSFCKNFSELTGAEGSETRHAAHQFRQESTCSSVSVLCGGMLLLPPSSPSPPPPIPKPNHLPSHTQIILYPKYAWVPQGTHLLGVPRCYKFLCLRLER